MRYALALTVAALVAPASLWAADPPVTFQTQPINRVLDDMRAAADLIGGEKAVKSFNDGIKEKFGEKGFDGLDLNRPVVGYVLLAPKLDDTTAVIAFPATNEKDFVALCDRILNFPPKDLGKGLYALPTVDPKHKAHMKFSDGYAYIAYGGNTESALDAKAIVPANKIADPAEQAIFVSKLHFDRLTPEVKKAIPSYLAEIKKELGFDGKNRGGLGLGGQELALFNPLFEQVEKMLVRYALLLTGGETAAVRLTLDVATGELAVEGALKGKPDTPLATAIAAQKPTANKFASLLTPDTVAGFKTRLPFFNDELRTGTVKALEEGQKQAQAPFFAPFKDLIDELFKGAIRTVKTGEVDVVSAVRGPDKNGDFNLVVAVAFEAPSGLEKEFRKVIEKEAPENLQGQFKWDADKLGKINIHTFKLSGDRELLELGKSFGGDKATVAFAFAPTGVFVTVGPDSVATLKAALAVKPVDAPVLDVVINPAKMKKFVEKAGGPSANIERALGKEDKLLSALSLNVTGGKELKVKFALNLRLLPKVLVVEGIDDGPPPVIDKK